MDQEQLKEAIQQGRVEVRLKSAHAVELQRWNTPSLTDEGAIAPDITKYFEWRLKEPALHALLYVVYWINGDRNQCYSAFSDKDKADNTAAKLLANPSVNRAVSIHEYAFKHDTPPKGSWPAGVSGYDEKPVVEEPTYRDLAVGEVIETGDQFYSERLQVWSDIVPLGSKVAPTDAHKFRRPLEPAPTEPEVGPGYIMLRADEVIRQGDEVRGKNNRYPTIWSPAGNIEGTPNDFQLKYRRYLGPAMVDPGVGYRILKNGETIGARDEWWEEGFKKWLTTDREGAFVGDHRTYRRAV